MITLPSNFNPTAFTSELYSYIAMLVGVFFLLVVGGVVIRYIRSGL